MTERASGRRSASEAVANDSTRFAAVSGAFRRLGPAIGRSGPVGVLVLVLGLAAGGFLIAAEVATYRQIDVLTASCEELTRSTPEIAEDCVTTGGEQHNLALALVALVVWLMAFGAGLGRSLPAAVALCVLGVLVLAIWLFGDRPDVDVTGAVGRNFDEAEGKAGATMTLEVIGGALALAAGAVRILAERRAR